MHDHPSQHIIDILGSPLWSKSVLRSGTIATSRPLCQ